MALSVQDFRAAFPAFADETAYTDEFVDRKLQESSRRINLDWFGDSADDAQGYLTAHLLSFASANAGQRPVQSVSAGGVSVTYASTSTTGFESTGYGQAYLALVKLRPGFTVLGCGGRPW